MSEGMLACVCVRVCTCVFLMMTLSRSVSPSPVELLSQSMSTIKTGWLRFMWTCTRLAMHDCQGQAALLKGTSIITSSISGAIRPPTRSFELKFKIQHELRAWLCLLKSKSSVLYFYKKKLTLETLFRSVRNTMNIIPPSTRIPPEPSSPPILSSRCPVVGQSKLWSSPAQHDSDQWQAASSPGWAVLPVLPGEFTFAIV